MRHLNYQLQWKIVAVAKVNQLLYTVVLLFCIGIAIGVSVALVLIILIACTLVVVMLFFM